MVVIRHDKVRIALTEMPPFGIGSAGFACFTQLTNAGEPRSRIAFFDEPTTNMDAERRENLAVQLSNIKHFDQLFVISHDDTFEGYVDNVVTIERGENETPPEAQASLIGSA